MTALAQMTGSTLPSPALLQRHLHRVHYPAGRDELLNHARSECARVIHTLEMLPDREYTRPTDISKALHERARQSMAGADYPADLDDLIRYASSAGADAAITDTLRQLPDGQYDNVDAVIIAIIEIEEE